ncbi:MAG: hypothetical protein JWQ09_5845 [Segetibacter sp.]|nr:hypothetical protein [Segetibacter sp.]
MKTKYTILLLIGCLLLASCVAHQHEKVNPDEYIIYGFWYGLWHGIISPITFVISLFSDHISVWETHNNGGWYTFGFLLGVGTLGGSSGRSSK